VHASGSIKDANDEIAHWFKKEEIFDYTLLNEAMLYDLSLDGIL
jgi:hypothetical protein